MVCFFVYSVDEIFEKVFAANIRQKKNEKRGKEMKRSERISMYINTENGKARSFHHFWERKKGERFKC
jgi:hypothetical protein